ncbi:hypothetical protein JB92DRAFT_3109735 [Gautieria morchelliformis]|nr:hypothetical protein JB92DRAFT_3109735 [Gautieria morchelliformis]
MPHIGLLQEDYCRGFIPSPYPFLAPHISISEPLVPDAYPAIARTSILKYQDHDYADRPIVAWAPAMGSPLSLVFNPAPQGAMELADEAPGGTCSASPASDVLPLDCDSDDDSASGSSECPPGENSPRDRDFLPTEKETHPQSAALIPASTFWIEEDDDDLPELPADW